MKIKKIGTPRPPSKPGLKFQYGRNEGELDMLILYRDAPPCDRALIMHFFTAENQRYDYKINGPKFEPSLVDELEKRGYDITTLRFTIDKKVPE